MVTTHISQVCAMRCYGNPNRYAGNSDVKQRLLHQLAHCGIAAIFTKVYASTHSAECLKTRQQHHHKQQQQTTGNGCHDCNSKYQQQPEEDLYAEVRLQDATTAMQNLVSAATCLWHVCERSATVCNDVATRGVVSLIVKDLSDSRLATGELLKDTSKVSRWAARQLSFTWDN